MADSTLDVIIRATAQGFPEATGMARQSLQQMDAAAKTASSSITSMRVATESAGRAASSARGGFFSLSQGLHDVEAAAFKTIGALSLIGFAAIEMKQAFSAVIDFFKSGIAYTAQFGTEVNSLAIELSALGKTGGKGFAQDLEYATVANEKLRASVLGLGGDIAGAERLFHEFVAAGLVPDTDAGIQSISRLQLILGTMVTSRRPMVTIQQEILQLLDGEMSKNNQIAQILERKLGLSEKQLENWVDQGIASGQFYNNLAKALDPGKAALDAYQNQLPVIQAQIKAMGDEIKRAGMEKAFADAKSGASEYRDFLTSHKQELIDAVATEADAVGKLELAWAAAKIALLGYATQAAKGITANIFGPNGTFWDISPLIGPPGRGVSAGPTILPSGLSEADRRMAERGIPSPADRPGKPDMSGRWQHGGGNDALTIQRDLIGEAAQRAEALAGRIEDTAKREAALAAIHMKEADAYQRLAATITDAGKAENLRLRATQLTTLAITEQRMAAKDAVDEQVQLSREFITNQMALGRMDTAGAIIATQRELSRLQAVPAGAPGFQEAQKQAEQEQIRIHNLSQQAVREHVQASLDFLEHIKQMGISNPADQLAGVRRIEDQFLTPTIQAYQAPGATASQRAAAEAALAERKRIDELIIAQQKAINNQLAQANKDELDEELRAVQSHMADLEVLGQLDYAMKVTLLNSEVAIVQAAEDQKWITQREAADKLTALHRELASAFMEAQRQQAEAAKKLSEEMLRDYMDLMKPIDEATKAVTGSISSGFTQAFDDIIFGAKRGHSALMDLLQTVGKSIVSSTTKIISENLTQSLGIEPMLQSLFGRVSAFSGGIGGPEDAMKRAQEMVAKAPTTMNVAATVFQKAVAEFQAAVAALKGATAGGPGSPTAPTGPFTNIPGVPAMTGVPGLSGSTGLVGEVASIGGLIGGPSVANTINRAGSIWNTISSAISSLFGGGGWSTGHLLLQGAGGIFPGSFTPIAAFAGGGIASGPMLGLVGESGPEAVVPLRSGKIPVDMGSSGGVTHNHFYIHAIDAQSFHEALQRNSRSVAHAWASELGSNHPMIRQIRR